MYYGSHPERLPYALFSMNEIKCDSFDFCPKEYGTRNVWTKGKYERLVRVPNKSPFCFLVLSMNGCREKCIWVVNTLVKFIHNRAYGMRKTTKIRRNTKKAHPHKNLKKGPYRQLFAHARDISRQRATWKCFRFAISAKF